MVLWSLVHKKSGNHSLVKFPVMKHYSAESEAQSMWNTELKMPRKAGTETEVIKQFNQNLVCQSPAVSNGLRYEKRLRGEKGTLSYFLNVVIQFSKLSILLQKTSKWLKNIKLRGEINIWEPCQIPPQVPITRCIWELAGNNNHGKMLLMGFVEVW